MKKIVALVAAITFASSVYAEDVVTNTVQPVVASVQKTTNLTEEKALELIEIKKTALPMRSKLRKHYSAYQIVITSEYPGTLQLKNGNIKNGFPGAAAYTQVETSPARMFWSALGGVAGLVVIGLPVLAIITSSNSKAERESMQYTNQINPTELRKGESVSFTALTMLGQQPDLGLTFRDKESDLTFVKNSQ